MYKDVSNGVNGFCRDSSGNKKLLGDWNVDSSDKCRALCDSFFACAGFQFGRNDNPQDCNLYYEAEQTSASTSAWTPCNKKLLGDWNVDSSDKCRALCDSFFACAG